MAYRGAAAAGVAEDSESRAAELYGRRGRQLHDILSSPPPDALRGNNRALGAMTELQNKLDSLDLRAPYKQTRSSLNKQDSVVENTGAAADSTPPKQEENLAGKQDASWVYMLSPPRSQISARYNPQETAAAAGGGEGGQDTGGNGNGGDSRSPRMHPSILSSSTTEYRNGVTTSSWTSPSTTSSSEQQHNMLSNGGGGSAGNAFANGSLAAMMRTKNGNHSASSHHHHQQQHGMQATATQNGNNSNNNNQFSNPSSGSISPPHMRECHQSPYHETELQQQSQSEEGQEGFFSSEMPTETSNQFSDNQQEAQLFSEKRILELRVAELRLAYDQMQQALVDAASKALSYRQDILEENIRLTYAVQVAEQDRLTYVQALMPLLTEFELRPPVSDAPSMVSYIKILVQRLRSELELYKVTVKDSQYYTLYQVPSFQPPQHYTPPTQSPPFQGNGFEIVPSFSLQLKFATPTPREAEIPYWERRASSSPHNYGLIGNNNSLVGNKDFNDQEQQYQINSRALVRHESPMGGHALVAATLATAEHFESDLLGDELLANNQSRDLDFDRFEVGPLLPTLAEEEPNSLSIQEDGDPLPGIEGLTIVGDAVLSGRLTTCGHSVNGTSLCIFQWIRQLPDGSQIIIDGAGQPEYMITADDCDSKVAINCIPLDEHNRQGEVVTVVANDGKWISQDSMMKDQINTCIANGYASFEVQLQEGTMEESQEPVTFLLRRLTYELWRNGAQQAISEKYATDVFVEIPVGGQIVQCIIKSHTSRKFILTWRDARMRDAAVLTFRAFLKMFIDEQKKKKHKWLRR